MSSALSIATSGMAAASLRLDASASNVANVLTTGPLPAASGSSASGSNTNGSGTGAFPNAYVPLRVDQTETAGGGTAATVSTVSPSYVPMYDPTAPYANANGSVAAPNVDLASEAVQQLVARYTFAMNAKVAKADSEMTQSLFDAIV